MNPRISRLAAGASACAALAISGVAWSATYQVGPDRQHKTLHDVVELLEPGDIVEVDGGATYPGDLHIRPGYGGTPQAKITIRGVPADGQRPVISGGDQFGVVFNASHYVFEGFDVTGAANACLIHKADDVTIRDVVVHDCPNHGILGTDWESGSLTIEFSEVYGCGSGMYEHQIYIATDETMYPGSVFRLQHSYVHDGNGGNNVKTRAERNEIYCNWIENSVYHGIDLVPPDGQDPWLAREDADVVGNVVIMDSEWYVSRMGSDYEDYGTDGRFRFAYNTFVSNASATAFFRLQFALESASFYNNAFLMSDGGSIPLVHDGDAWWVSGEQVDGARNFVASSLDAASFFTDTVTGADPGFVTSFVPGEGSPLVDRGGSIGMGPPGYEVPNGWALPDCVPPNGAKNDDLVAYGRPLHGVPDIGAYELGTTFEPGPGPGPGGGGSGGGGAGGDGSGDGDDRGAEDGCGVAGDRSSGAAAPLLMALLLAWTRRRSRHLAS